MTMMRPLRWVVHTLAVVLACVALLSLLLRALVANAEVLTPRIEALLSSLTDATVTIEHFSLDLARNDLQLHLKGLNARADAQPLVALDSLELSLDLWASLRQLMPVFGDAELEGLDFHLYEGANGTWQWPEPATLPLYLIPETELDLPRVDFWSELLVRQSARIEQAQLMLHGQHDTLMLKAPELLLSGNEARSRLQGSIDVVEGLRRDGPVTQQAVTLRGEMRPGEHGIDDFSADLEVELAFDAFVALVDLFRPEYAAHLEQVGGDMRLWGSWQAGRFDSAHLDLHIPQLTLRQALQYAVLRDIEAQGVWQRDGDGGQAWLSGDAKSVKWAQPTGYVAGPALPRTWYAEHQPGRWEVRTSEFELASLVAWRDFLFLPESITRVMDTLAPRGEVTGLRLGQRDGHWGVDAALTNVSVLPWQQAPGGGPVDAWVQARDVRGRVEFTSPDDSTLYFPEVFASPIRLTSASGEVKWVYDGPATMVSGKRLRAAWNGADVEGEFGLYAGQSGGHLGLDLAFANADALDTPLIHWLPMNLFDANLREWLSQDIGGIVERGVVRVSQPWRSGRNRDDAESERLGTATVGLEIRDGHLPMGDELPMLEAMNGRLLWQNEVLEAQIDHAESHGVVASQGELRYADDTLALSGALQSDGDSLLAFLKALPVEGMDTLDDLRASGEVTGDVALALPLDEPERLALEVNTAPRFDWVRYLPLGVEARSIAGELTWQQRDEAYALTGSVDGRALGGSVRAEVDTPHNSVRLSGDATPEALFALADSDMDPARLPLTGRAAWQGRVTLEPSVRLDVESALSGIRSTLPAPFDKRAGDAWPWRLGIDFDQSHLVSRLGSLASVEASAINQQWRGAVAVGNALDTGVTLPQSGWRLAAGLDEVDIDAWQQALSPLLDSGEERRFELSDLALPPLQGQFDIGCLRLRGACVEQLRAEASAQGNSAQLTLEGNTLSGRARYAANERYPLDISVVSLALDPWLDVGERVEPQPVAAPGHWLNELDTDQSPPMGLPEWLGELPDGRLRVAEISWDGGRAGPLTAYWQSAEDGLTLSPVGLTLGQLTARGALHWQGNRISSHTHTALSLAGRDVGTALERLGQPAAMRSSELSASATLDWPGAPWQFLPYRAGGELAAEVKDGSFLALDSAPVKLVGLLNFDNILRRLRLDFSDVTGRGTAFDHIQGEADIAAGQLRLRGPLQIDMPSANLRLTGSVDLAQRTLDQRLGVVLPVSQALPVAALAAGAPIAGGVLLVVHQLFGDALGRATTIHYRVRGPWSSPQVTLEGT